MLVNSSVVHFKSVGIDFGLNQLLTIENEDIINPIWTGLLARS